MKCSHCGSEIKVGSIYCKACGRAAQIVPDYNLLENDILTSILEDKDVEDDAAKNGETEGEKADLQKGRRRCKKKSVRRTVLLAVALIVVCIVAGAGLYLNSYGYHMRTGKYLDQEKSYQEALEHFLKALERRGNDAEALAWAGHESYLLKDYSAAEDYLLRAVAGDSANKQAYLDLIRLYLATADYDKLEQLRDTSDHADIAALFDEYMIIPPTFSVAGGKFTDDVLLELYSSENDEIFFTLDGSNPTGGSGILYQEPIELIDGTTTVKAACKNKAGEFSRIMEQQYQIAYERPAYPKVTPMQGTFETPTKITMETEGEGSRIYYTWDGSTPTSASNLYSGPIDVPEGNNVLSILVIDKHGLCSDILKCNYKFLP